MRDLLRYAEELHTSLLAFITKPNDDRYRTLEIKMESNALYSPEVFRCVSFNGFSHLYDMVNLPDKVDLRKEADYSYEDTVTRLFNLYRKHVPREIQLESYLARNETSFYSPIECAFSNSGNIPAIKKMIELSIDLLLGDYALQLKTDEQEMLVDILMPNDYGYSVLYNAFKTKDKNIITPIVALYSKFLYPHELKEVVLKKVEHIPSLLCIALESKDNDLMNIAVELSITAFSKDEEYAVEYFLDALSKAIEYENFNAIVKIVNCFIQSNLRVDHDDWYSILFQSFHANDLAIPEHLMTFTFSMKESSTTVMTLEEQQALISEECGYDLLHSAIYCSHDEDTRMAKYNDRVLNPLITVILKKLKPREVEKLLCFETYDVESDELPDTVLDIAIQADNMSVAKKLISLIMDLHKKRYMDYYTALEMQRPYYMPEELALFIQKCDAVILKFDHEKQHGRQSKQRHNKRKRYDDTGSSRSMRTRNRNTVFYHRRSTITEEVLRMPEGKGKKKYDADSLPNLTIRYCSTWNSLPGRTI